MAIRLFKNTSAIRGNADKGTRALAWVLAAAGFASPLAAQDTGFQDFPAVVYCEFKGIFHAYYFSQLGADGQVIYLRPDSQGAYITASGLTEPVKGDRPGNCADKTLKDLREAGQAFDLQK